MQSTMAWRYVATLWQRAFGINVSQVSPLLFVGGQFQPQQWPKLYALGIRVVLSLQAEYEDQFIEPLPIRRHRLLVPDFHPPTIEQLEEAVRFIQAAHAEQLPVLVHCHAGVGRAPLTAAAFLIAEGLTLEAAYNQLRAARPIIRNNQSQQQRLIEWANHIQAE
jgi:protein-tyrosine phosphatase